MKNRIAYIVLLFALALTSCKGMPMSSITGDGAQPEGIPTQESSLTDVGNPEEEDVSMMKVYDNPEFEVRIEYDGSLDIQKTGNEEVEFTSTRGDDVVATFRWLDREDSLDAFLVDNGVDAAPLIEVTPTPFDKTLCASPLDMGDSLRMECYHYQDYGQRGKFVVPVKGLVSKETLGMKVEPYGIKMPLEAMKKAAEAAAKLPPGEVITFDDEDDSSKIDDSEETEVLPKPKQPPNRVIIVVPEE